MRMADVLLVSVSLFVLVQQSTSVAKKKLRPWRGFLIFSKDECETRCQWKHGYFWSPANNEYLQAARGSVYRILMKCQCRTSRELKKLIREKYGRAAKLKFSSLSAVGLTGRARSMLRTMSNKLREEPIRFISADEVDTSSLTAKLFGDPTEGSTVGYPQTKPQWSSHAAVVHPSGSGLVHPPEHGLVHLPKPKRKWWQRLGHKRSSVHEPR